MKPQAYRKYLPEFLRNNRLFLISLTAGIVINIIIWILFLSKFGVSSEPAPLHFSVVYGIDFVGPSYRIYQIPLVGLVVLVLNWYFAGRVRGRLGPVGYFLTFGALFVQVVLLLAAGALIFLNR